MVGSRINSKLKVSLAVKPLRDVSEKVPIWKKGPRTKRCPYLEVSATKVLPVKVKPPNVAVELKAPPLNAPNTVPVNSRLLPSAEYVEIANKTKIASA